MNDMIGASGMLQGWAAVWRMEVVWLLAMLGACVAATTVVERLILTVRPHLPDATFVSARAALKSHFWAAKPK